MDTVTVIIPMYNAEKYIRQCLQSVISQTYQSLEIVVIDDGSTDCSREICEELSFTDDRIQLYHQENGGVSRARNYGLDVATGEYIFFLDSDDTVYPQLFEEMIRVMEEQGAGMAFCSYRKMESCQLEESLREMSLEGKKMQWRTVWRRRSGCTGSTRMRFPASAAKWFEGNW